MTRPTTSRPPGLPLAGLLLAALLSAPAAHADTVVANTTLRAGAVIGRDDVRLAVGPAKGPLALEQVIGKEARRTLYPGRPVAPADIGPPTLVTRNAIITMSYQHGGLGIHAVGRALDRGGMDERIRVMNLDSRTTVIGRVIGAGEVAVTK